MATISAHIFHLLRSVSLNEHPVLINAWLLLAMWAFCFLECICSLYLVVIIANALLRWTNGNTPLTVCEWYVRGTLQEAVLNPLASLSELSYSKSLVSALPLDGDKHLWQTPWEVCNSVSKCQLIWRFGASGYFSICFSFAFFHVQSFIPRNLLSCSLPKGNLIPSSKGSLNFLLLTF